MRTVYIKTHTDGTTVSSVVDLPEFSLQAAYNHIGVRTAGPMDAAAIRPKEGIISVQLAQKQPWTYETHVFVKAR